jgi:hypothetical protein
MSLHRFLSGSSVSHVLTLLLGAIILALFQDRWTAEASPRLRSPSTPLTKLHRRINNNHPGPDVSDYPPDEVIYAVCGELERDQSVMFTEIGDSFPAKWFAKLNGKKIYTDLFPDDPEPFTLMNGRSLKWYQDFADRYSRIFAERSSGDVFLVSNWPKGPQSRCSVWYRIEFPVLKMNPAVDRVILVNKLNYYQQVEIWPEDRRSPEDRGGDDPGGGGSTPNPRPNRPSPVGIVTGLGLLLGGGFPALGTLIVPPLDPDEETPVPLPPDTPPYDPDGENLQDVIFGNTASLPDHDWSAFTMDESLDGAEFSMLAQHGDGTDPLFALDDLDFSIWPEADDSVLPADIFASESTDIFAANEYQLQRRHFAVLDRRDGGTTCFNWAGNGDDPAVISSSREFIFEEPTSVPREGGKTIWATVRVVQHEKDESTSNYGFDLTIFEGDHTELAHESGLQAPPGEWVGILSPLPYRVHVMPGYHDWDPLRFRYGQTEWDSNDVEGHGCQLDEWRAGSREGECRFVY